LYASTSLAVALATRCASSYASRTFSSCASRAPEGVARSTMAHCSAGSVCACGADVKV
jgi:hypothetical protein